MKTFVSLFVSNLIFIGVAFAQESTLTVDNMTCGACVKQVNKAVCQDKEIASWFESCKVDLKNPESKAGQVHLKMKKAITLDAEKKQKIEAALASSGRKVLEYK